MVYGVAWNKSEIIIDIPDVNLLMFLISVKSRKRISRRGNANDVLLHSWQRDLARDFLTQFLIILTFSIFY
jgi:hypothetical protein